MWISLNSFDWSGFIVQVTYQNDSCQYQKEWDDLSLCWFQTKNIQLIIYPDLFNKESFQTI